MKAYILIDRSGSMASRWEEANKAIDTYIEGLAKEPATAGALVTLAYFDESGGTKFEVMRRNTGVTAWRALDTKEIAPRGGTPLHDAIGKLISMAESEAPEKATIVIMTDGMENASREMSRDAARASLDRCRARGWDVVFLGADFDAVQQGASLGNAMGSSLNAVAGNYAAAAATMTMRSAAYAKTGLAPDFTEEDRAKASGAKR